MQVRVCVGGHFEGMCILSCVIRTGVRMLKTDDLEMQKKLLTPGGGEVGSRTFLAFVSHQ